MTLLVMKWRKIVDVSILFSGTLTEIKPNVFKIKTFSGKFHDEQTQDF